MSAASTSRVERGDGDPGRDLDITRITQGAAPRSVTDGFDGFQGPAAREDRQAPK